MLKISYILIALSCLAFVLAIILSVFNFSVFPVAAEGFSRACNNLALIAIAFALYANKKPVQ